jgi:adenylate kinase family enzyme
MQKIAVVGCGGSGKSFLARQLAAIREVPVTHLDAVFYDTEWNELPAADFAEAQRSLVAEHGWVIDGNYRSTLPIRLAACDTVVLVDVSTAAAL